MQDFDFLFSFPTRPLFYGCLPGCSSLMSAKAADSILQKLADAEVIEII